MVPAEVVARREACNLAYLPIGALEWHGSHMPLGTDCLSVEYLSQEAARRFGGVAFPALVYADVRYVLHECRVEWRHSYAQAMQVPEAWAAAFPCENADGSCGYDCPTQPDDGPLPEDPLPFSLEEQSRDFARQIARALLAIHLYGFRRILLLPGHGPQPGCCTRGVEIYRENVARRSVWGPPAQTRMLLYIELAMESEPLLKNHWIHADKWEGSFTMVAAPGTVHPEYLPEDRQTLAPAYLGHPYLTETDGYNPELKELWPSFDALDPRNMDEDYGRAQADVVIAGLGGIVQEMLADSEK
jgi:creatinine amidohydrolase/Fe(II)-dependent formamide hydrolase-like protein